MCDAGRNLLDLLHQDPGKKLLGMLKRQPTDDKDVTESVSYRRMTNEPHRLDAVAPNTLVPEGVCAKILLPGADIRYMSRLYDDIEASKVLDALQTERHARPWRRMGYGREVMQWSQPGGLSYSFSDGMYTADSFPDFAISIKHRIEQVLSPIYGGLIFNYCVCNYYATGRAGVFWHADDEPEICEDSPIACVSFGSERVFSLISQACTTAQAPLDLRLQHGSLVVMAGMTQKNYLHSIQKEASVTQPRFSLTFRVHRVSFSDF